MLRLIARQMGVDVAKELSVALLRRQLSVALALGENVTPKVLSAWRDQHPGVSDETFQLIFEEEQATSGRRA